MQEYKHLGTGDTEAVSGNEELLRAGLRELPRTAAVRGDTMQPVPPPRPRPSPALHPSPGWKSFPQRPLEGPHRLR